MATKKIPVTLSKNDYAYLHYIQQGSIYSGKPLSEALLVTDILKATVFHCSLDFYFNWEKYGRNIVEEFLKADGKYSTNLPKTQREFSLDIENYMTNDLLKQLIETNPEQTRIENNEPLGSMSDNYAKKGLYGQPPTDEPGVSTFIMALNDHEMEVFELTKKVIEKYRGKTTSFSEVARGFFRHLFVNVDWSIEDAFVPRHKERFNLLSIIYIGDLYGFTAVESVMIHHNLTRYLDVPISHDQLAKLRLLYTDKPIFDFYIQEMGTHNKVKQQMGKKKIDARTSWGFPVFWAYPVENIQLNHSLSERFRSSNASFNFHSAYLGYTLLFGEWFFDQHQLPLLACYLNGSSGDNSRLLSLTDDAMEWFHGEMEDLFAKSAGYNESPGTIITPKKSS